MSQNTLLALSVLVIQIIIAYSLAGGFWFIIAGALTMLFSVSIIYYAVKSIMNNQNLIFSILLMFSKYPIVILCMYLITKRPDFNVISYASGILIILPCLVILSYRKSIK